MLVSCKSMMERRRTSGIKWVVRETIGKEKEL